MALTPGTRLGPYEILALIGAGGMGEVYRARDSRMGRDVAVKVSATFSDRFEREVHTVAALNHPNISHIYDVGPNYLVMELIEGPTLADRISEGPIPLDEALTIARQIADALEAAHEKGIIHRDLKPANIKLTSDAAVKVLDFGLAKLSDPMAAAGNASESPTMEMGRTIAGEIIGTAAYMAPEQARGRVVDRRADIWAFGVVLYEMLIGERLFGGETITDTLSSVLTKEPDWNRVPLKARRLLSRCLEKDPKRRLRDIGDAWELLDLAQPAHATKSAAAWKVAAAALTVALTTTLWILWHPADPTVGPHVVTLDLDLGADVVLGTSIAAPVILSPDGTRLAFVSQGQDGVRRLFTRRLNEPRANALAKTDGAFAPFFSPDGEWIGFFAGSKLKKTRIDGGDPIDLCDASSGRGASFAADGSIVAALDAQAGLSQVVPGRVKPLTITEFRKGEVTHRWPQVLPDGDTVLFTAGTDYGNFDESVIAAVSLKDHHIKTVLEHAGMYPRYVASGYLLYVSKDTLFARAFDISRLEVSGEAVSLGQVSSDLIMGFAQVDFSQTGAVAYRNGRTEGFRRLAWVDANGQQTLLPYEPGVISTLRLSPTGDRVAVTLNQGTNTDIWIYETARANATRVTNGMRVNQMPVWSRPDGRFLVFFAIGGMFSARTDGTGTPQKLTESNATQFPTSFSSDGKRLVYSEATSGGAEIKISPVESSAGGLRVGEPSTLVKTQTISTFAALSPDGHWLAYSDRESGRYEVYVRAVPATAERIPVSQGGGIIPAWSLNGHELFYRTEENRIMVVPYSVRRARFEAQTPRLWSSTSLAWAGMGVNFDLAPDGKRLAALIPAASTGPRETQSHVIVMVNFFDELRRRLPAPK